MRSPFVIFLLFPAIAFSILPQGIGTLKLKIEDAARRSSLDPLLVEAVVSVESGFKSNVTSKKGAMGLMQVMPSTADECNIQNPYHATDNLMGACECLRRLMNRFQGNVKLALAAYNAGPTPVERYGGIPPFPETMGYVKKVLKKYQELKRSRY